MDFGADAGVGDGGGGIEDSRDRKREVKLQPEIGTIEV